MNYYFGLTKGRDTINMPEHTLYVLGDDKKGHHMDNVHLWGLKPSMRSRLREVGHDLLVTVLFIHIFLTITPKHNIAISISHTISIIIWILRY
jgi:hypothetical protein